MSQDQHEYKPDPSNADPKVSINGELVAREEAKVSVFDAGFLVGDGVREDLRLHDGGLPFLDLHLDHLYESAKAIDLDIGLSREQLVERILATLRANGMHDHVYIRLAVTRGPQATLRRDLHCGTGPPTIVVVPEYMGPSPETSPQGIRLFTVHTRRGAPDLQDSGLNGILAGMQAHKAGCDAALMLDPSGFVATCNAMHFFIVRKDEVWTSTSKYCLGDITRANVLRLCRDHGIPMCERDFSLADVYGAEEALVADTGTGLTHVREVDGRRLGDGQRGPMCTHLQTLYGQLVTREARAGVQV